MLYIYTPNYRVHNYFEDKTNINHKKSLEQVKKTTKT